MYTTCASLLLILLFAMPANGNPVPCTGCNCCAAHLITVTTTGAGAHAMASDVIIEDGQCSVRTFTCRGKEANIEVNDDGVVSGPSEAKFTVTCNAAGTAWEAQGLVVRAVECASL
ncbi:hypothetical protein PRIPAC_76879 [Pristionchus pacificus]|uniref:C6 domain-containing protein n=1 Tax=Pristionchus pacificus TaxID=54126 RepID=A0A2A6CM62_PRIPA|nr:hypothetical protein PRIPAC_76879 [Pristionchus pacificus]|eukprot:PDM79188.1 hypothetical protein PRIPAC_31767 [Pristionchus pacificus]